MTAPFFLEILNGGAVTPEMIWIAILAVYLSREANRRGLRFYDWFKLPPSMNLILAVFIFDFAIVVRSQLIWAWRRFDGAGNFGAMQTAILIVSGALIVIGTLCKIRAFTYPEYGNGPWLVSSALSALAIVGLIIF